jgi:DNA-directed RNA polymerase subunit L
MVAVENVLAGEHGGRPCPGRLEFDVSGYDASMVNALRRSILCDVPGVALRFDPEDSERQDAVFTRNTGGLHREALGHRVSLVPVHLPAADLADFDPSAWSVEMDVENTTAGRLDVTSASLRALKNGEEVAGVFPPDPLSGDHVLITVLAPPSKGVVQGIRFRGTLTKSTGADHLRYRPVSVCGFVPLLPPGGGEGDGAEGGPPAPPSSFRFFLESVGPMAPSRVVEAGLEALSARMASLAQSFRSASATAGSAPGRARYLSAAEDGSVTVEVDGEGHTALALLQHKMLESACDYFGYNKPHTLIDTSTVRLRLVDDEADPFKALASACEEIALGVEADRKVFATALP